VLATVAVGSLLIVALLPTLQSDRENLRRAICANNLREIGQAMIMYSDDFRGSFPISAPVSDESGTLLLKNEVGIAGGAPACPTYGSAAFVPAGLAAGSFTKRHRVATAPPLWAVCTNA